MKQTALHSTQSLPSLVPALLLAGSIAAHGAAVEITNPPPASAVPPQSHAPVSPDSPAVAEEPALTEDTPPQTIPPGQAGARIAQSLYFRGKYKESAAAYLQAARGSNRQLGGTLAYNAACALYRAGQYQAAAEQFTQAARGTKRHAAAGTYDAGCAWFRLAEQAISGSESNRNYAARPLLLDRAGQEFQRALRLDTDRTSARDNLATVVQLLPEARQEAKVRALLEKYGTSSPDQIADTLLTGQRKLIEDMAPAMTNATPAHIDMMEALAERQRENIDLLIPLRASLASSMAQTAPLPGAGASNVPANPQQQMAEINQHLDAVQNVMQASRDALRNLENNAYVSAATAELGIYNFWKAVAPFPKLLREDLRRQTNAIDQTSLVITQATDTIHQDILAQQEEATQLTQLFADRFTQSVPPEGLKPPPKPAGTNTAATPGAAHLPAPTASAAGATNAAPEEEGITPEKRARIIELAREAKDRQKQASKLLTDSKLQDSLVEQRESYALLQEIEKLLPKDKNQQQQDQQKQQQQQDQQKQDQQQDQPKQQPPEQKKEEPPSPKQNQPPPEQQPPQEQPPQPAQEDQPKPNDQDMTPEQARRLLEKAQQREKEHKEERERNQYIPPSPVEKDW